MSRLLLSMVTALFVVSSNLTWAGGTQAQVQAPVQEQQKPEGVYEKHPYGFSIVRNAKSPEYYQIKPTQQETYPGIIKKTVSSLRANYDMYRQDDKQNKWQITAITRVLSLSGVYSAKDTDVYDTRNVHIGMIDGSVVTTAALTKFNIYQYSASHKAIKVATANANADFSHAAVYAVADDSKPLAEFNTRFDNKNNTRVLEVRVYDPAVVDDRIMRMFAVLFIDSQGELKGPAE